MVDDVFVGMISPQLLDKETATVGVWIAPQAQGRGYGKAALLALCEMLRARGVTKVLYETEPANSASIKLAESAGFLVEGEDVMVRFSKHLR